jgi:3',5'-nucleoside bisphosphate phosphatase
MAATDHDTTAAIADVYRRARERGIEAIPGIEVTAIEDGRDVHVLGYFLNAADTTFAAFLTGQRETRLSRVRAIADRLATLGLPTDVGPLLAQVATQPSRSIGRPQIARAMVAAGHVADTKEAFDRWLGRDCPAFVPRSGPSPERVIDAIHGAGGLASLAHPGRTGIDPRIPALARAGLDALEVYHSDHDAETIARYAQMARELDLLVTGGSDFHGDPVHGVRLGTAMLPDHEWRRLRAARHRHAVA